MAGEEEQRDALVNDVSRESEPTDIGTGRWKTLRYSPSAAT